jgi:hypothetical protein
MSQVSRESEKDIAFAGINSGDIIRSLGRLARAALAEIGL